MGFGGTSGRDGRLVRFAPAAAVLVVFAAGSAIVFADGGSTALIHGCLQRQEETPNLIIVGANDPCPSGTTPIHWPAISSSQPPPAAQAGTSAVALDAVPPPKKANKKLYKSQGVQLKNTETVTEVYTQQLPASGEVGVEGGASCPGSYPYRMTGADYFSPGIPALYFPSPFDGYNSGPVGEHGWYGSRSGLGLGGNTVKLTVSVTCAKVKGK